MNKEQIKNIVTYGATLVIFVAGLFGIAIGEETAQMIAIGIAMIALCAYGLWKNHNLSAEAVLAQKVLNELKRHVLTEETVVDMLNSVKED